MLMLWQQAFAFENTANLFKAGTDVPAGKANLGEARDVRELGAALFN
jgi:hypothetical protein